MKVVAALLVLLWAPAWSRAEDKFESISLTKPEHIRIEYPAGWKIEKSQADQLNAADVRIYPENKRVHLHLTFMENTAGLKSQVELDKLCERRGLFYAAGSVEKKVEPISLDSKNGVSSLAKFTDASLVGKETKPDQYKVILSGTMVVGDCLIAISLNGDAFDSADFKTAMALLKSHVALAK
ncbi:MAG TPA: hypothetical protein VFE24_09635 [Pirellulales bacterium]|nr:hypothetical protein [Pirellulales bacterium]